MYYVYQLINNITGKVFYVGKGKGDRMKMHAYEANGGIQSYKCNYIRKLWADGGDIEYRQVYFFEDQKDAYDAERLMIDEIGLENLTNVIRGGVMKPETIAAIRGRKEQLKLISENIKRGMACKSFSKEIDSGVFRDRCVQVIYGIVNGHHIAALGMNYYQLCKRILQIAITAFANEAQRDLWYCRMIMESDEIIRQRCQLEEICPEAV